MATDRDQLKLRSPLRQPLRRAARTGQMVDDDELSELGLTGPEREEYIKAAQLIVRTSNSGGMRSRAQAAQLAEQLCDGLIETLPASNPHALPEPRGGDLDAAQTRAITDAVLDRQTGRRHDAWGESVDQRADRLAAQRQADPRRRG